jgi:dephospho-CoA kinase
MKQIGLTGSIGMGKSTTARLFADEGVPVYDADAAVHALYAKGGAAVEPVEAAFAGTVVEGAIDRERLGAAVLGKPEAMKMLEQIVHPLVGKSRADFLQSARASGADLVVLDIPLLFETGGEAHMDAVIVVTAPAELQRQRVLERPGMTDEKLKAILARQTPDSEKRRRAHFVIDTSRGLDHARDQVRASLADLRSGAFVKPA